MSTRTQKLTKRQQRLADKALLKFPSIDSLNLSLKHMDPLTSNQVKAWRSFDNGDHICMYGSAGTGKSFVSMYLALREIADKKSPYRKLLIIRSAQPSKQIGFLPGSEKDKLAVYEAPYKGICNELYGRGDAYEVLKNKGIIEFTSTSFLRGTTIDDTIILLDEAQNLSFVELLTVATRVGVNTRIVVCGDTRQDDLTSERYKETSGMGDILKVFSIMPGVSMIQFTTDDIVRSGFVKDFLIAVEKLCLS